VIVLLALALLMAALRVAHPDRVLVQGAIAGQRASLRTLARRLMPTIVGRIRLHLGANVVAGRDRDDIAQDVWLTLMRDDGRLLLEWDPERGRTLEGYVGLLTRRVLWQTRRDGARQRRGGGQHHEVYEDQAGEPTGDPETHAASRLELERVVSHLRDTLPPRGKLVFELLYADRLSPKEAADAIGVKLQVVYNWQHRIRKESRTLLER